MAESLEILENIVANTEQKKFYKQVLIEFLKTGQIANCYLNKNDNTILKNFEMFKEFIKSICMERP